MSGTVIDIKKNEPPKKPTYRDAFDAMDEEAERLTRCPTCGVAPGWMCQTKSGKSREPHAARTKQLRRIYAMGWDLGNEYGRAGGA